MTNSILLSLPLLNWERERERGEIRGFIVLRHRSSLPHTTSKREEGVTEGKFTFPTLGRDAEKKNGEWNALSFRL